MGRFSIEGFSPSLVIAQPHTLDSTCSSLTPPRRPAAARAATTADMLLDMLATLLEGGSPDLRDLLFIREQILANMDIYAPLNLGDQLRDANLDVSAEASNRLGR